MVQGMHLPPQYGYKPMSGSLFPTTYPFNYQEIYDEFSYYWLKYFISQTSFFSLPKRPIYVNYEVLINAMNMNVIDFSHADIQELKSDSMTEKELEKLLELHNMYTKERFELRQEQVANLDDLEQRITKKQE
mgnify:CR=1 FL=1